LVESGKKIGNRYMKPRGLSLDTLAFALKVVSMLIQNASFLASAQCSYASRCQYIQCLSRFRFCHYYPVDPEVILGTCGVAQTSLTVQWQTYLTALMKHGEIPSAMSLSSSEDAVALQNVHEILARVKVMC
jgi:hypothetical protein